MLRRAGVDVQRDAGVIATLAVVAIAIAVGAAAFAQPPLRPDTWSFVPTTRWPWWPGVPSETLIAFVVAQLVLGVAAFARQPRSGVSQALLAGSAGNAASVTPWTTVNPEQLASPSASWAMFIAAGILSLLLWSSLVHLIFVFPTRDRRLEKAPWIVPLLYVAPQALLLMAVLAIGGLTPTSLAWLDIWPRIHAAIVSLLLVVGIVGLYVRFRSVSPARQRQVRWIALSVAATAIASLLLIDLPVTLGGAPIVPRPMVVLLALPIPVLFAFALWQDRGYRFDRLRRSRMALLHAREEERRRLRRDLHDGLGPTLAAIGLKVDSAASWIERDPARARELLGEVRNDLTAAIADTRRLVRGLRPPALDELGLVAAVRRLADELGTGSAPQITVSADGLPPLPAAVDVAAYRIVQEGLTNAVRHAKAEHIEVLLGVTDGTFRVEVRDDGIGFEPGQGSGVGTEAMRERAEELGGECLIARGDTSGTRVVVTLPVSAA